MAQPNTYQDTFPLEQLFQRLELAGFRLSPGDRLRALRVLGGPGKAVLGQPEQLKLLLAPVLTRSAAEQLKFYEIFDRYYLEVSAPLAVAEPPANDWWRWLLILPLLAGLWYAYYALTQQRPSQEQLAVYIDGPTTGSPGDTILLKNLSRYSGDSSKLKWRWSYVNLATQHEELFDTAHFDWTLVLPSLDSGSYLREIRLEVMDGGRDTTYRAVHPFRVNCPELPPVTALLANKNSSFEIGQDIRVEAVRTDNAPAILTDLLYTWDFGDGSAPVQGISHRHAYAQNGQYTIRLSVEDTTANGWCTTSSSLEVKIGREQAFIPLRELRQDRVSLLATWGWGYYVLLGLLGISLVYYWVRWLMRRRQRIAPEQEKIAHDEALYARFSHSDKGPYFLPLRDQSDAIQYNPVETQLADALRMRQEGVRQEIDVDDTLAATIQGGGFPAVRFRFASQPSEYLCLIDEQDRASHLGRLFKYLANKLRNQDAHLEIYYYRKHPNQFWNKYFPKGRTLDQLQRAYPHHRLLVLGDLHELIDPHAQGRPGLRAARARLLRQWTDRLLLTPVPPVSWSYREKLLARLFNVFPADSPGLLAAAQHLETEAELLPDGTAFDRWRSRLQEQRTDVDTEHRKWRRWRSIKDYLGHYDRALVRWFAALSVFPLPSWEMTLAIGRALGIEITYDKLLILARIPTLQGDRFDERLRRELQGDLSPADERLARAAVQAELKAVRAISAGSHAQQDLETQLAIQDFALAPHDPEHREALRFLLRGNLLKPSQEAELDRITGQAQPAMEKAMTKAAPPPPSVRDWLEEDVDYELDAPKKETPTDRRDLRRAMILTAVYIVMLVVGWQLGGTDYLYQLAFAETPEARAAQPDTPLRDYLLVKETAVIDSAVIYNNEGVTQAGIGGNRDTLAAGYFRQALRAANNLIHGKGDRFNGKTIPYALANANLGKLYFNAAVTELNGYLQDSLGQNILPDALGLLDRAYISDSVALDVWHARGVIHYYAGSPADSSNYYYELLDSLDYFQTLEYSPNLATLLQRERSRIIALEVEQGDNRALAVNVRYYLDPSVERSAELTLTPLGSGTQPAAQTQPARPGENTLTFTLEAPRRNPGRQQRLEVTLRRSDIVKTIDQKEEIYAHNWAADPAPTPDRVPLDPRGDGISTYDIGGTLLDANTRKPINGNIQLIFLENTNQLQVYNETANLFGSFSLSDIPEGLFASTNRINLQVDGYKTYEFDARKINYLGQDSYELGEILLAPEIPLPEMVRINGGSFEMGSSEKNAPDDVRPQHEVRVSDFSIGRHEVTFAEYDRFCEATQREKPADEGWGRGQRPVINISWEDATAYCDWLSEQHGFTPWYGYADSKVQGPASGTRNGYRLPTEAEWEYAARGGIMGNRSQIYAGGNDLSEVGWYNQNSKDRTQPVGRLRANNAGTHDMSGNVWEWCQDWYGGYPYEAQNNPTGPGSGSHRIIRGGAWIQSASDCTVTVRQYRRPEERTVYVGFRLAR